MTEKDEFVKDLLKAADLLQWPDMAYGNEAKVMADKLRNAANGMHLTKAAKAEQLLLELTPGGSEYVGDPERCARWARDRIRTTAKIAAERNQLKAQLDVAFENRQWLIEQLQQVKLVGNTLSRLWQSRWTYIALSAISL